MAIGGEGAAALGRWREQVAGGGREARRHAPPRALSGGTPRTGSDESLRSR